MVLKIEGELTEAHKASVEAAMNEESLFLHINSFGGDVFSALDIYNALKKFKGELRIEIEGLCASAATIVACAGRSSIAENGLYMIHKPSRELFGMYESAELTKALNALNAVEETLVTIYAAKTGLSAERLRQMMEEETWLTASEAVSQGFADELGSFQATVEMREDAVIVNELPIALGRFKNTSALMRMEAKRMTNTELWTKLQGLFGLGKGAELNAAANEIERLKAEIAQLTVENERLKVEADAADRIAKLIEGNLKSGASGVQASAPDADRKAAAIENVVKFARGNRK